MKNQNDVWMQWNDSHALTEQVKRQGRALDKKLTPLTVIANEGSGTFKGSSGQYSTTLSDCTCSDFSRRKLPCKHMYRLANALDLFQLSGNICNADSPPLNKNEAIKYIQENLTPDEQKSFGSFCYTCGNDNKSQTLLSSDYADKLLHLELACEVLDSAKLLQYLNISVVRTFLPPGTKNPRTKNELISLVAPLVSKDDITFPNGEKCLILHSRISHLAHTLHRRIYEMYPDVNGND